MRARAEGPLRVAAYCRVSTDKEDQRNSLSAQRQFFQAYIDAHPDWTLAGVFADEGLSGTSVKRRPQFTGMLRRAMEGELDLILTKEVSRFARNTVDALQVTRRLKERGVGVLFLNDNIDTRENDGEFRLTIMASVAQEESRKVSERTRWGQLQAMKRGVAFGNDSLYGYTVRGGALTVQPEQAQVVRAVYRKYLEEGKGAHTIARELTQDGVRPPLRPDGAWSSAMVLRLLRNEKYCGDLLQRKYRTTDHLSHRKIPNDGTEEQFCLRDHHEAIVSRAQFEAAQAELARRAALAADRGRHSAKHWYSGKVRCGGCGRSLTVKRTRRPNGTEYQRFVCRGRLEGARACGMRAVHGAVVLACARHVLGQLGLDGRTIAAQALREALAQARTGQEADGLEQVRRAARRQEARKARALEAYLDGTLNREDWRRLAERCGAELGRLEEEAQALERARAAAWDPARAAALREALERALEGGDAVLDESIRRITVYEDHFLVEVAELPVGFRVRAEGRGTGRRYHVVVTECTPVPLEGDAGEADP